MTRHDDGNGVGSRLLPNIQPSGLVIDEMGLKTRLRDMLGSILGNPVEWDGEESEKRPGRAWEGFVSLINSASERQLVILFREGRYRR